MAAVPCLRRRPSSRLYPTECIKMFHLIVILPSLSVSLFDKTTSAEIFISARFQPFSGKFTPVFHSDIAAM